MSTIQLPPMIWQALGTLLVFGASAILGADLVGGWLMTALSVVAGLLKLWQVQQAGDAGSVSTRGMAGQSSKWRQWWLE